jgi:DNA-binding NarL/FixJ family response regulator
VHRGESHLSPAIARKVMEQLRTLPEPVRTAPVPQPASEPAEPLTDKEARILDLIAQGRSNKQIAATVFLAEGTVKNYVSRIMEKLHAESRIELAMRAAQRRG